MKMSKLIDYVYDHLYKNNPEFKEMSLDAQGEVCILIASFIKEV